MILKHKDDVTPLLAELDRFLANPSLTKSQREQVEEQVWKIRTGAKGEKEAAYHIDFHWKDGKHSAVIHDLRIEHGGRVAQIDHLILHRRLDCHVIESKAFGREVRISASGEWETRTRYGWKGIPSPVEQNRRHIEVLKAFIKEKNLAPMRLGFAMPITFHNWVLISPECQITRTGGEWERVVKMDMFDKQFRKQIDEERALDTFASMAKFVSLETVQTFAQALVQGHKPGTFDFAARFGVRSPSTPPPLPMRIEPLSSSVADICAGCREHLNAEVIRYCRLNAKRFRAQLFCRSCQSKTKPGCDGCGVALDQKIIAFCRFNAKKLGGKRLCRACQNVPVPS